MRWKQAPSPEMANGQHPNAAESTCTERGDDRLEAVLTTQENSNRRGAGQESDGESKNKHGPKENPTAKDNIMQEGELDVEETLSNTKAETPTEEPVKVRLISSVRVPPRKSVIVPVRVQGDSTGTMMLELFGRKNQPEVSQSLLDLSETGIARLIVSNKTHVTQTMKRGTVVGTALSADVIDPSTLIELSQDPQEDVVQVQVNKIGSNTIWSAEKVE